tara:strand:- start:13072 stop:13311 length:240 start_codon:yes stop_codon:yes gene_type:complete
MRKKKLKNNKKEIEKYQCGFCLNKYPEHELMIIMPYNNFNGSPAMFCLRCQITIFRQILSRIDKSLNKERSAPKLDTRL